MRSELLTSKGRCVLALLAAACGSPDEEVTGCKACEIENLEGSCVPKADGCDYSGPYVGYYGDDPGVFRPIDPERGVYLDGGEFTIPPASERTQCTYHPFGESGTEFILGRWEARMNPGSHHFNMFQADPAILQAAGVEFGVPRDCVQGAVPVPLYIAGSEWEYVDVPAPEGFGRRIQGGIVLEMQMHYVNPGVEEIIGHVEANLFRRDASEVEHFGGLHFNLLTGFEIPPKQTKTVRARCPARPGISVAMLMSHMHRFGRRFTIDHFDAFGITRRVYDSTDYDHPKIVHMETDPIVIGENEGFEWACEYDNVEDFPVTEGEMGLSNEMCIMVATYWDETEPVSACVQQPM